MQHLHLPRYVHLEAAQDGDDAKGAHHTRLRLPKVRLLLKPPRRQRTTPRACNGSFNTTFDAAFSVHDVALRVVME
jgi:hypothetical protein